MQCPKCGCESVVKFGTDRKGNQRFRCEGCRKTFSAPRALAGRKTTMTEAVNVLKMLLEGMSVRSCERLTGMASDTILSLVVEAGESCQRFMESNIVKYPAATIECDEQWAFIFCKRKTAERLGKNTEQCGDRYVFTAIDRDSKLLLCWHAGQRGQDDTWTFADKLFKATSGRPTINTDGFTSYTSAIPLTFHHNCDYAQIVKNFQNGGGNSAQARYSPGSITSVTKTVVCGDVPEHEIGTSRMERFNLTTRMTLRRFTRLTNGFSKKTRNHDAMLGLYFAWYNWCRKHMTLKTTPAVKAGLASQQWTLEQLLTAAAAA
ncbi:MAG: DDE-type integrase/transposase/recombinase [Planctomycetaceae bacterium]